MSDSVPDGSDKGCILIVDDNDTNQDVLILGLTKYGYRVEVAQSGLEALEMVNASIPDLILLDILMSGLDGFEVCRQLKSKPSLRDIPVIFVSALNETFDKVRGFDAGGIDYLTKPFEFREVLARIETHLNLSRQRKEIRYLLVQREHAESLEREQRMTVNALLASAMGLNATLKLDEVLERILHDVGQLVAHDIASIMLIEGSEGWFAGFHSHLGYKWPVPTHRFPIQGIGVIDRMRETGQPCIIADTLTDSGWKQLLHYETIRSFIGAPIFADDKLIGALGLLAEVPNLYTAGSAQRLQAFALLAALAIKNARLYEHAQELAVMQERQRLARELHDSLTQTLFSANAIAEVLPQIVASDAQRANKYMTDLAGLTQGAMVAMRSLMVELRPEALTRTELGLLMKQLSDMFSVQTQIPVRLQISDRILLPPDEQIALYRIAQEALNNTARYARATEVNLSLCLKAGYVELVVRDNGCGFDSGQILAAHFGLSIMRERAAGIGAELTISSEPGVGTQIAVRGPML